jgi:L-arabinose isomerase
MSKVREYHNYSYTGSQQGFDLLRELSEYIKKLKDQNKETLNILINLIDKELIDDADEHNEICLTIEKYKGKPIEEVLKDENI